MATYPTDYPEVNKALSQLSSSIEMVLGKQFLGMYLYGSLATGDFSLETSDIDFVVVTTKKISNKSFELLAEMHEWLLSGHSKWIEKLEGSYISQEAFRRFDSEDETAWPTLNEKNFYLAPHQSDWIIQRYVVREQGVVIVGPRPESLIDPVSVDELRQAVIGYLNEWWLPMRNFPDRLKEDEYQAYAILSMCRAAHLLEHGIVVSKQDAAKWVAERLDAKWQPIIESALAWRTGQPLGYFTETIDLISLVGERSLSFETVRE